MHCSNFFRAIGLMTLIFGYTLSAVAQQPSVLSSESFNLSAYLLIGSRQDVRGDIGDDLRQMAGEIKREFNLRSIRSGGALRAVTSSKGSIEIKTTSDLFSVGLSQSSFIEWSMSDVDLVGDKIQVKSFRLGIRAPFKTSSFKNEAGATTDAVNYENTGLSIRNLRLVGSSPSLVGTLNVPNSQEMIFIVVKAVVVQ